IFTSIRPASSMYLCSTPFSITDPFAGVSNPVFAISRCAQRSGREFRAVAVGVLWWAVLNFGKHASAIWQANSHHPFGPLPRVMFPTEWEGISRMNQRPCGAFRINGIGSTAITDEVHLNRNRTRLETGFLSDPAIRLDHVHNRCRLAGANFTLRQRDKNGADRILNVALTFDGRQRE